LGGLVAQGWIASSGEGAELLEPVQMTQFGRLIREGIMQESDLDVTAETVAFASARLHACSMIRDLAIAKPRRLLILERWAGAVIAYGRVAGTDSNLLGSIEHLLLKAVDIQYTFFLSIPGSVAAKRLINEQAPNKFETRGAGYLERVNAEYRRWAEVRDVGILEGGYRAAGELAQSVLAEIANE